MPGFRMQVSEAPPVRILLKRKNNREASLHSRLRPIPPLVELLRTASAEVGVDAAVVVVDAVMGGAMDGIEAQNRAFHGQ